MAKVVSINVSDKKGVVKTPVKEGTFIKDHGIEGDAHGGKWHRQVSLLAQESIDYAMKKDGLELTPGMFAENLTTEGVVLHELPVGTKVRIGETLQEVTQIGKKCHSKCEIYFKTGDCVMPREGIFTAVLKGGAIKVGDPVEIMKE
ncbi:MOSC domain-containing protein [Isachenkonia alkalipeptolytica]|uniref:MOSC domain-containing protein n=1 Tax=Isachenkonia alkalipeptolytica TaxID=2565777 RepID=A0AA43XIP6_9CLOT|nr:MOSC domain-containing protein [Isachenkonia alkalipeptolytica]NBG87049.1 MOSC domain-containing protein [Isachenkonia alkalipeptolytica]